MSERPRERLKPLPRRNPSKLRRNPWHWRDRTLSLWLRKHGYRRRKAQKTKTMGPRNPNRNAQFENIARLKKEYLKAGLPVISMDTKKKELLGNFYREGKIDTQATIETNDHDFGSAGGGVVIP